MELPSGAVAIAGSGLLPFSCFSLSCCSTGVVGGLRFSVPLFRTGNGCFLAGVSWRSIEEGKLVADAFTDGICCMSLELCPLLNGFLLGLDFFSGEDGRSEDGVLCFRRPITVPNRLRPPIPPGRGS